MKAKLVNIREGKIRSKQCHTVIFFFQKVINIPGSKETMLDGVDYALTLDLVKLFGNERCCQTNNEYDPQKGAVFVHEKYKINQQFESMNLVSVSIKDLCSHSYIIKAETGQQVSKINRVFFCSEEEAVNCLRDEVERGLMTGYYLPPSEPECESRAKKVFVYDVKEFFTSNLNEKYIIISLIEELENLSPDVKKLFYASLNIIKYKLILNLNQKYAGDKRVMTNGRFDERKALALCKEEFPIGKVINFDGELYSFEISDITNGEYNIIQNNITFWTSSILFYAHFGHDEQEARNSCNQLLQTGRFILKKTNL